MRTIICYFILFICLNLAGETLDFMNDLSFSYLFFDTEKSSGRNFTGDLLSQLDLYIYDNGSFYIDAEITSELSFDYNQYRKEVSQKEKADLYRAWMRMAGEKYDLRIGLQKINFGPAQLLRSLQWFDQLDPRDPDQTTSGVESIVFRRFFGSSGVIWLWLINGENKFRGTDIFNSAEGEIESGARLEIPFRLCESGFTMHYRKLEDNFLLGKNTDELRAAIDLRWDLEVGFWLEAVTIRTNSSDFFAKWQKKLTLGCDYTFDIGNGFHTMVEHMFYSFSGNDIWENDEINDLSAVSISYPLSMFSSLQSLFFYDWDHEITTLFLSYHLDFDYWGIYLQGSWIDNEIINEIDIQPMNKYIGITLETKF